jgi:hypothetical protein
MLGIDGKEMGRGLPAHPFSDVSESAVVPTCEPSRANGSCWAGVWIFSVEYPRSNPLGKSLQGVADLCSGVSDRNRLLGMEHHGTKVSITFDCRFEQRRKDGINRSWHKKTVDSDATDQTLYREMILAAFIRS